jgi:hypothetical protein
MPVVRPTAARRVAALAMGAAALALAANTVLPWWPHDCPHHAAMAAAVPAEGLAPAAADEAEPHDHAAHLAALAAAGEPDAAADHHDHAAHMAALAAAAAPDPHAGHHRHHGAAAANADLHADHAAPAAPPAAAHRGHTGHAGHGDGPGMSAPCFGAGGGHGDSEVPCTCDGRTPPVVHLPSAVVLLPTTASVLATLPREVGRRVHRAVTLPRRSFPPHSLPLAQAPPRAG